MILPDDASIGATPRIEVRHIARGGVSVLGAGSCSDGCEGGHGFVPARACVTPLLAFVRLTEGGLYPLSKPPHPRLVPLRSAAEQRKPHRGKVERYFALVEVIGVGGVAHGDRRYGE